MPHHYRTYLAFFPASNKSFLTDSPASAVSLSATQSFTDSLFIAFPDSACLVPNTMPHSYSLALYLTPGNNFSIIYYCFISLQAMFI